MQRSNSETNCFCKIHFKEITIAIPHMTAIAVIKLLFYWDQ